MDSFEEFKLWKEIEEENIKRVPSRMYDDFSKTDQSIITGIFLLFLKMDRKVNLMYVTYILRKLVRIATVVYVLIFLFAGLAISTQLVPITIFFILNAIVPMILKNLMHSNYEMYKKISSMLECLNLSFDEFMAIVENHF